MIKIKKEESVIIHNRFVSIVVTGHANYAPIGYDIVCSAISTLYQTLIMTLEKYNIEGIAKKGDEEKQILLIRNPSKETKIMIDFFFIGVSAIAQDYSEYVKIV